MPTTHTEAVLNKLSKSELVQLVLQTEASIASQITNLPTEVKDLLGYFKKLESDLAVTELKHLDPTKLSFTEGAKKLINESLCPYYRGIWNKCKKFRANQKLHQFYIINGIVRVKLEGNSPPKSITHMLDLVNLFPDIEIDSL